MARAKRSRLLLLFAVVLLGCDPQPESSLEVVTVGQTQATTLTLAPLIFAQSLGFFRDEGLSIEIIEFDGTGTLLPQLARKRVTIGYPNPDPLIINAQPGRDHLPLKFFYNATRISAWEIAVPAESSVHEVADLRGSTLGVGSLTFGNIPITKSILADAGLTAGEDVPLLPVGLGGPAYRALTSGEVAALNLFDEQHAILERTGVALRRLNLPERYTQLFSNGFATHIDTVRDRPDVLARFGRALAKGTVACNAAPENCVRSFWQTYPSRRSMLVAGSDPLQANVRVMQARLRKWMAFEGEASRFGEYSQRRWLDFVDVLYRGGQLRSKDIDVSSLYTNELVDEFNQFDRTLVEQAARAWKPSGS